VVREKSAGLFGKTLLPNRFKKFDRL